MNNYPPGVSGREYQISGHLREYTELHTVICGDPECIMYDTEHDVDLLVQDYGDESNWVWVCDYCDNENLWRVPKDEV
jgi:hypothetical protein